MQAYLKLKALFKQLSQLADIQGIMGWDEAVMMPEGAGQDRAQAMATLHGITHKLLTSKRNKNLLAAAKQEGGLSDWDRANIKWMEKKYLSAACISPSLTTKLITASMSSEQAWRKLRVQNNWREFLPYFKRLFNLVQEVAKRRGEALQLSPYDAMIDGHAPGFNQATIDPLFSSLKKTIPELIQAITHKQAHETPKAPMGPFPIEKQKILALKAMTAMGFNFHQGRVDVSHHPFCGGNASDVRITTRYNDKEFFSSLAGICHETGHGLYEQGLPLAWRGQPVGEVNSMAMHESQSLLMESVVCCSQAFYRYLEYDIQQAFGPQEALNAENLYQLATRVQPNLIRVDSDEVTYQMHIILRYELEKQLLSGALMVKDLPECWHAMMQQYLNLSTLGNDQNGVMQDVHWPSGAFGYFPAYTLGRLISAQLFASFLATQPHFEAELAQGNFQSLNTWLQKNVYAYASSLGTNDFLIKVTGKPLDAGYFIAHVRGRYGVM